MRLSAVPNRPTFRLDGSRRSQRTGRRSTNSGVFAEKRRPRACQSSSEATLTTSCARILASNLRSHRRADAYSLRPRRRVTEPERWTSANGSIPRDNMRTANHRPSRVRHCGFGESVKPTQSDNTQENARCELLSWSKSSNHCGACAVLDGTTDLPNVEPTPPSMLSRRD